MRIFLLIVIFAVVAIAADEPKPPTLILDSVMIYWRAEAEAQKADLEALKKHMTRDAAQSVLIKQCGANATLAVTQDLTLFCLPNSQEKKVQ